MLQLTHAAALELGDTLRAQGLPNSAGIRVFGDPSPAGEMRLGVALVELPAEDDQVTEREGTKLFVAPEVAEPLAGAMLDAVRTEEGVKLVLVEEDAGDSPR